jgi:hypothetical protein
MYTKLVKEQSISVNKYEEIEMKCMYEGYDDWYRFSMIFSFPFLLKEKNQMKWMTTMEPRHEYGGLMDELIDTKCLSHIISSLKLT